MVSRKSFKEQSEINSSELDDNLGSLRLLQNIALTSRGPDGKVKVIQNSAGGHVTLTSLSGRLLSMLSISKPLLKMLTSSTEGQIQAFGDGGLFLIVCCVNIIELSENSPTGNRVLVELFDELMELALDVLKSDQFLGKIKLSLTSTVHMLSLVKTIFSSKPLCKLSDDSLTLIASMVVECFLSSVKDDNKNTNSVLILTTDCLPVNQSHYLPGILMLYPEISPSSVKKFQFVRKDSKILVALVTASMSGDSEEIMQGHFIQRGEFVAEQTVMELLETFCKHLIDCSVGLLMCQRVIHPTLKVKLRQNGVFVIERMGARFTSYIQNLTGK